MGRDRERERDKVKERQEESGRKTDPWREGETDI